MGERTCSESTVSFAASPSNIPEVSFIGSSELLQASIVTSKGVFWIELSFPDEFLAH